MITLAAVGDVMLGRWVGKRIAKVGTDQFFSGFSKELNQADMTFANLECALTKTTKSANKKIVLRADPALAPALSRAGFSVLSLANNHALDFGESGLDETVSALKAANLVPIGRESDPMLWELKGVTVAFLAYCDFPRDSGGKGIRYTDEETLAADISLAKQQGTDVVVVAWHWGTEGSAKPNARQRHLARLAASAGADLILGSHPHVLQPVEWIPRNDGRRCLVAYSLGNFIFDAVKEPERRTAILKVRLGKGGVQGYTLSSYRIQNGAPIPIQK